MCIEINDMLLDDSNIQLADNTVNTQTRLRDLIFEMELMEDSGSNITEVGNRFCDIVLMARDTTDPAEKLRLIEKAERMI